MTTALILKEFKLAEFEHAFVWMAKEMSWATLLLKIQGKWRFLTKICCNICAKKECNFP